MPRRTSEIQVCLLSCDCGGITSCVNTFSAIQLNLSGYETQKSKLCSKLPRFTLLIPPLQSVSLRGATSRVASIQSPGTQEQQKHNQRRHQGCQSDVYTYTHLPQTIDSDSNPDFKLFDLHSFTVLLHSTFLCEYSGLHPIEIMLSHTPLSI